MPNFSRIHRKLLMGRHFCKLGIIFRISMSKVKSSLELDSARELLHRSTEARNEGRKIATVAIKELLQRPKNRVLVKSTPLLEYLDPLPVNASRTFE